MLIKPEIKFHYNIVCFSCLTGVLNDAEGGSSPVWNEKFVFRVEYPGSGDQYKLNLKIMDKDVFSSDDFVGQAV